MFNKSEPAMKPTNSRKPSGAPSIIGSDVQIDGNLTSSSEVQLDGQVRGDIQCGALVMGESGAVQGNIRADEVTIRGQVDGDIRARVVHLEQSATINGDVVHESLTVESGAKLNGRFTYGSGADLAATPAKAAAE